MGREATAVELRTRAAAERQEARESFERCDTDGFLSQWASGINARLHEAQARIAENNGMAVFARTVLVDAETGEAVAGARIVRTRFGMRWRIDETDEWLAYMPERASTLARKGYAEAEIVEWAEAAACIDGSGTGLSGAASCYVRTYRKDAQRSDGWRCVGIASDERPAAAR